MKWNPKIFTWSSIWFRSRNMGSACSLPAADNTGSALGRFLIRRYNFFARVHAPIVRRTTRTRGADPWRNGLVDRSAGGAAIAERQTRAHNICRKGSAFCMASQPNNTSTLAGLRLEWMRREGRNQLKDKILQELKRLAGDESVRKNFCANTGVEKASVGSECLDQAR